MLIQFKQDAELEVVNAFDEDADKPNTTDEIFRKGEQHDVDLLDDHGETMDVQFGDGSVCFGLPKGILAETLFFTVVDPDGEDVQDRIEFVRPSDGDGPVQFRFPPKVCINQQQLWELGCLFLALSGGLEKHQIDRESGAELVEGYGLKVPPELDKLCGIAE